MTAGSHPSRLERALLSTLGRRPLLLGLDFDGTLAPLASRPERARLTAAAKRLLARLAGRPDCEVAIVSGRELADLKARVGVPGLHYAGNHGLEIDGPLARWSHPRADEVRRAIRAVKSALGPEVRREPGIIIEDKSLTLSIHYRLAQPGRREPLRSRVASAVRRAARGMRLSFGHMVWEVRPRVRWNKGDALLDLARRLPGRPAIVMIGDDRTDEEAFRRLGRRAISVRVGDADSTHAGFRLASPQEVLSLLERLARARR